MSLPLLLAPLASAFEAIGAAGPLLQATLGLGTTALSFAGQTQMANSQQAAIDQANADARVQTISDYDQLTRVGQQERAAATQKTTANLIDTKRAAATASASASEAGVGGLSVVGLLSDIYGQSARIQDGVNQNIDNTQQQLGVDFANTQRGLKNTLNTRPAVNRPSLVGALMEGTTAIGSAYKDKLRVNSKLQ